MGALLLLFLWVRRRLAARAARPPRPRMSVAEARAWLAPPIIYSRSLAPIYSEAISVYLDDVRRCSTITGPTYAQLNPPRPPKPPRQRNQIAPALLAHAIDRVLDERTEVTIEGDEIRVVVSLRAPWPAPAPPVLSYYPGEISDGRPPVGPAERNAG